MKYLISILLFVSLIIFPTKNTAETYHIDIPKNNIKDLPNHIVKINVIFKRNNLIISGTGSGIIIYKDRDWSYILTNRHVIYQQDNLSNKIEINSYQFNDVYPIFLKSSVGTLECVSDENKDIAILKCKSSDIVGTPTKLKSKVDSIGTRTVLVAYPMGELLLTEGLLTRYYTHRSSFAIKASSFVEFGASGGGLFDEDLDLIGMTYGFSGYNNEVYIRNSGIFISTVEICGLIKKNKLDFLLSNQK